MAWGGGGGSWTRETSHSPHPMGRRGGAGFMLAAKSDLLSLCSVRVTVTSTEMRGKSCSPERVRYFGVRT